MVQAKPNEIHEISCFFVPEGEPTEVGCGQGCPPYWGIRQSRKSEVEEVKEARGPFGPVQIFLKKLPPQAATTFLDFCVLRLTPNQ